MRWTVVVASASQAVPLELVSGRALRIGRGRGVAVELNDPRALERQGTLSVTPEGLLLTVARGGVEVSLNDVQVTGTRLVHAGDVVGVGSVRLTAFPHVTPSRPSPVMLDADAFVGRVDEELRRARGQGIRPVGVVVLRFPGLNVAARAALTQRVIDDVARRGVVATWGVFALDAVGAVLPEVEAATLDSLLAALPEVAGPRATVAHAVAPRDGWHAHALLDVALSRVLGMPPVENPVFASRSMMQLAHFARGASRPALVCGPRGSGRATLAKVVLGPTRDVHAADSAALASLGAEPVLVRELGALDRPSVEALRKRLGPSLVATAETPLPGFDVVFAVPALAARPDDVLPLALHVLGEARLRLDRPRLALGHDARQVLQAWQWPGNVRELRSVVLRAALASVRDEVGRDALPHPLTANAPAEAFRASIAAAERELLLDALAHTRWNVTAAAARLGVPRRTVVYRLSKLGLKRPVR